MSTKAAREALYEQWYDELTVEINETLKVHAALVKNSSLAELNEVLQARLTKLFELHERSIKWKDLLLVEVVEILAEVKVECEQGQVLVSQPSGKRSRKPKLTGCAKSVRDLSVEPKGEGGFDTLPISS